MNRVRIEAYGEQTSLNEWKRRAAQRLVLCFPSESSSPFRHSLDPELRKLLHEIHPAAFRVGAANVEEPAQLLDLTRESRALLPSSLPPLFLFDPRGSPLPPPFTPWPSKLVLGQTDHPRWTARIARAMARELSAAGMNLILEPCVELADRPDCFDTAPAQVRSHALSFARGLRAGGLIPVVRGFPGAAPLPSQDGSLPSIDRELGDLEERELQALRALLGLDRTSKGLNPVAGPSASPALFLPNVLVPALDERRPASHSPKVISGYLRSELGFRKIILCGEMGSLEHPARAAVEACASSADLLLVPAIPEILLEIWEALVRFQEQEPASDDTFDASDRRLAQLRRVCLQPDGSRLIEVTLRGTLENIGCTEHRTLALGPQALEVLGEEDA